MKNQLHYCLALWHTPKVGSATFAKLIEQFPNLQDLFTVSWQDLIEQGVSAELAAQLQNPNWQAVERDLAWAKQPNNHLLTWHDAAYPLLLNEASSAPLVLYIQGDPNILNKPQVAMVGSRNPSPTGADAAYQFAKTLAASGLTITSGLALGIDAASHQGALAANGLTIAVMGTGPDFVYPTRHYKLAQDIIAQGGAVITELPPGMKALAEHFPRRNRIISGLSMGTLVIEAALKSGSLITARYAIEQGREVFAMPGSIHNPLARGCHYLIKQGAKLVETATDILEELGTLLQVVLPLDEPPGTKQMLDLSGLDADHAKLIEHIGFETTPIDIVIERSNFSADKVTAMLTMLEIKGLVSAVPGGYLRKSL